MSAACVTPALVHAAEAAVRSEPSLRAVLLYGSRARGDHRPDSDWDIALVTTGGHEVERPCVVPEGWEGVAHDGAFDFLRISGACLSRKANALGHIACPISREAVLLAGEWTPPPLQQPVMEADEYGRKIQRVLELLEDACDDLARLPTGWSVRSDLAKCTRVLEASAYGAAELAKGMLGRRGEEPERTHKLPDLAKRFAEPALAEAVLALDGDVHTDHLAGYEARPTPEQMQRAVNRLADTVDLFLPELREAMSDAALGAVAREDMRQARASVRRFAAQLRDAGGAPAPPPEGEEGDSLDKSVLAALQDRPRLAQRLEAALALDVRALTARPGAARGAPARPRARSSASGQGSG